MWKDADVNMDKAVRKIFKEIFKGSVQIGFAATAIIIPSLLLLLYLIGEFSLEVILIYCGSILILDAFFCLINFSRITKVKYLEGTIIEYIELLDCNPSQYYYEIEAEDGNIYKGRALSCNKEAKGEKGYLFDCMKGAKSNL